jgi:hypothetical protein
MANGNGLSRLSEGFWIKAAGWTFGLWALMLPLSAKMIIDSVSEEQRARQAMEVEFVKYREDVIRSMTSMAERQRIVLERLEKIDKRLEQLDERTHANNGVRQ